MWGATSPPSTFQPRSNLAALDASNGSLQSWNPSANGEVDALAVSGSTVYVGGSFTGTNSIGGADRNHIAALDATSGAADPTWDPGANGAVLALSVSGSAVYAGGTFSGAGSIGGADRDYLAALDPLTGTATSWNPQANGSVDALAVLGSTVYAGGTFSGTGSIGGADLDYLAALDTGSALATSWDPSPNGAVRSLALSGTGSVVYAGGDFAGTNSIGGADRNHLAALDASTGGAMAWNPNPDASVLALAASGGEVYAGGRFVTAGPKVVDRANIAHLNPDGTVDETWNPGAGGGVDPKVNSLVLSGSRLYVGGSFSTLSDGVNGTGPNLGALEAITGAVDTTWAPSADDQVLALALSPLADRVYVAGSFLALNGGSDPYLAAVDTSGAVDGSWSSGANAPVAALGVAGDGTIYAGGSFSSIGGAAHANLAALSPGDGTALGGWAADADGPVAALGVAGDGTVYAGGSFGSIGGATRSNLAALSPSDGTTLARLGARCRWTQSARSRSPATARSMPAVTSPPSAARSGPDLARSARRAR